MQQLGVKMVFKWVTGIARGGLTLCATTLATSSAFKKVFSMIQYAGLGVHLCPCILNEVK